jgi:hypothetical protein
MASNAETEMRWVNAWDALFGLLNDHPCAKCRLPDDSIVSVQECQRWLQESVYAGYEVHIQLGWIQGRRGIIVSRQALAE